MSRILVAVVLVSACGEETDGPLSVGILDGTVTDGVAPIANATVSVGNETTTTGTDGSYSFVAVLPGSWDISVIADWHVAEAESVEVIAARRVTTDFDLEVAPLNVQAADAALANTFNQSSDWTSDAVSIAHVSAPTRALLELAIHYRNPALYRDPAGEAQVTPSTLPTVATPATIDFEVGSGTQTGEQALDVATVVDDISGEPFETPSDGLLLWDPALHYLLNNWNFDDATPLYAVGVAVRAQKWVDPPISTLPTQEIERVHVHNGELWVEVVFQDFVDLAGDITDADGDGLREIWARVNPVHFDAALYAELRDNYVAATHGTLELAEILDENLDVLYSRGTNANVTHSIGVQFSHPDLGAVAYPFAVVVHGTVAVTNVFLMEP